jgi:hypothetical protein
MCLKFCCLTKNFKECCSQNLKRYYLDVPKDVPTGVTAPITMLIALGI